MARAAGVAVVTGASSGIGKETAKALAASGWRVIGIGRDAARSADAAKEIGAASTGGGVEMLRGDLSLLADAERLATEIAGLTDHIDLLVNNAGGMAKEKVVTAEGNEQNFASNHLGPFLLTDRLLPLLKRAATGAPAGSVRIINTASDASEMIPGFNWDDLQGLENFNSGASYCRAKLANVLFARGLAKRLEDDGIVAYSVHPGAVDSNFLAHAPDSTKATMSQYDLLTPEQGADTVIWLATAEEPGENGGYYHQRQIKTPNPVAEDDASVERLWTESEKLVAKAGY